MKKVVKIVAALLLLAMFAVACNNYVCPAYSEDSSVQQNDSERG